MRFDRYDVPFRSHLRSRGTILDPEEDWQARTVDVGVAKANPKPLAGERESEVDRHGALADSALPDADCHHMLVRAESHAARPRIATSAGVRDRCTFGPANHDLHVGRAQLTKSSSDRVIELDEFSRPDICNAR